MQGDFDRVDGLLGRVLEVRKAIAPALKGRDGGQHSPNRSRKADALICGSFNSAGYLLERSYRTSQKGIVQDFLPRRPKGSANGKDRRKVGSRTGGGCGPLRPGDNDSELFIAEMHD